MSGRKAQNAEISKLKEEAETAKTAHIERTSNLTQRISQLEVYELSFPTVMEPSPTSLIAPSGL